MVAFAQNTLAAGNIEHTLLIHAGSGVCMINLLFDKKDLTAADKAIQALDSLGERCRAAAGNLVIHHAPPDLKKRLQIWGEENADFILIKRVKEQLDPSGILCPGRFVGGL
jgi:glycolate oxidase FAD binding subunit